MAGSIFLETTSGPVEMTETQWEAEDRLQELLMKYPNMLAGEQMNEAVPRKWLLISREFGIPGEVDAGNRWSLDHLFLDQDAVPTLIEVKRSTDTRIRREVVGQMFDYASHLVTNVSAERIRQSFELTHSNGDADSSLAEALGHDVDPEAFWERLKDNIAANKLRLVFVADEFPPELKRIVEFLNRQMQQTEVFAVEVRQYVSPDSLHRTLVPRLVGKVESKGAISTGSGPGARWDNVRFQEALRAADAASIPTFERLQRFGASLTGRDMEWGMGRERGSLTARLVHNRQRCSLFSVYTTGEVSINLGWHFEALNRLDPFFTENLREKTNSTFHQMLSKQTWEKGWPMMPLSAVAEDFPRFESFMRQASTDLKLLIAGEESA